MNKMLHNFTSNELVELVSINAEFKSYFISFEIKKTRKVMFIFFKLGLRKKTWFV